MKNKIVIIISCVIILLSIVILLITSSEKEDDPVLYESVTEVQITDETITEETTVVDEIPYKDFEELVQENTGSSYVRADFSNDSVIRSFPEDSILYYSELLTAPSNYNWNVDLLTEIYASLESSGFTSDMIYTLECLCLNNNIDKVSYSRSRVYVPFDVINSLIIHINNSDVILAVVDSGVYILNPDLIPNAK